MTVSEGFLRCGRYPGKGDNCDRDGQKRAQGSRSRPLALYP